MLQLVPSEGSRFEVMADDEPIFSKLETDRFPEYDEIKKSLQDLQIDLIARNDISVQRADQGLCQTDKRTTQQIEHLEDKASASPNTEDEASANWH